MDPDSLTAGDLQRGGGVAETVRIGRKPWRRCMAESDPMQPVRIVRFGGSKSAVDLCLTWPAAVEGRRAVPLRSRPTPAPEYVFDQRMSW